MLRAFIKRVLGIKSPSAKANGFDYELDYLRAQKLEKRLLKAYPDKILTNRDKLKALEDMANSPIYPDFHVYETIRQVEYKPVILKAIRFTPPEVYRACYNDPYYIKSVKRGFIEALEPEIVKRLVIKTDFNKDLGQYETKAYFKFYEEA